MNLDLYRSIRADFVPAHRAIAQARWAPPARINFMPDGIATIADGAFTVSVERADDEPRETEGRFTSRWEPGAIHTGKWVQRPSDDSGFRWRGRNQFEFYVPATTIADCRRYWTSAGYCKADAENKAREAVRAEFKEATEPTPLYGVKVTYTVDGETLAEADVWGVNYESINATARELMDQCRPEAEERLADIVGERARRKAVCSAARVAVVAPLSRAERIMASWILDTVTA